MRGLCRRVRRINVARMDATVPGIGPAIVIAATFTLAGFVKGVIGLGLPTIPVGPLMLARAPAHVAALPAVPYLQALGLDKDDLVQGLGLSFTVSTLALAGSLAGEGAFDLSVAGASLVALLPACLGMLAGQWLRARVKPEPFRLCFFAGLL